ncbi:MAG TPA: ABC transporter permease [Pseudonocardiaceae bacterium]|jgi:ABC-type proline/glycine betaine transport system permease subunit
MTAEVAPPGQPTAATATASGPGRLWRNRSLIVPPVLVLVGLVLVALYVSNQQLDNVEQRILDPGDLLDRLGEHLLLTGYSTLIVIVLAVPLGILLSRPGVGSAQTGVLAFGGFMQALPPFGVIILLAVVVGAGRLGATIALVIASFLPVLTNTVVGLRQVDPALIEAARGMGMSASRTLLKVELPLAVPVMVAGIRVALVLNVGTATLASYVGAGGLGVPIDSALKLGRAEAAFAVSALVAALALMIDWLAGLAQHLVSGRVS